MRSWAYLHIRVNPSEPRPTCMQSQLIGGMRRYDNCWCDPKDDVVLRYSAMRDALNATGRSILYSMCVWGVGNSWRWGKEVRREREMIETAHGRIIWTSVLWFDNVTMAAAVHESVLQRYRPSAARPILI